MCYCVCETVDVRDIVTKAPSTVVSNADATFGKRRRQTHHRIRDTNYDTVPLPVPICRSDRSRLPTSDSPTRGVFVRPAAHACGVSRGAQSPFRRQSSLLSNCQHRKKGKEHLWRRTHQKALATPRRPCSPEGRCARERPQHASAAPYSRPEHILPRHLGLVGAQRGGRRHAAGIWGSRRPTSTHGRVAPRPTIWRRTDAPRPRIRTRLRRAAGHRPAPHRATTALQHEARSRHIV